MPRQSFYQLVGVSTPFDPSNRFTTSIILPPFALAILRLALSLYAFVTIFFILAWECTHGRSYRARYWFSYFTNLSYFGLAFYFLFAGLHSLSYAWRGRSWLNSWPRPLQAAHSIYYSTITVFPPIVTVVYWVILYNTWYIEDEQAWSNVSLVIVQAGMFLIWMSDIATWSQFPLRPCRSLPDQDEPPATSSSRISYLNSGFISRACIHITCHSWVLRLFIS